MLLKNQLIPSTKLLSVTNLPSVLGCGKDFRCILTVLSTSNTTIQTIHSNCDLTIYGIVIDAGSQLRTKNTPHDFVYIKNNDLPKEVEPIVAKNSITAILQTTNLPTEVEPIVA